MRKKYLALQSSESFEAGWEDEEKGRYAPLLHLRNKLSLLTATGAGTSLG